MDTELGKFIAVFVMVILPIAFILLRRFESHDEEIMELKNRINKLENKEIENDKDFIKWWKKLLRHFK